MWFSGATHLEIGQNWDSRPKLAVSFLILVYLPSWLLAASDSLPFLWLKVLTLIKMPSFLSIDATQLLVVKTYQLIIFKTPSTQMS